MQTTDNSCFSVLEGMTIAGTEQKIKGQFLCLWGCVFLTAGQKINRNQQILLTLFSHIDWLPYVF